MKNISFLAILSLASIIFFSTCSSNHKNSSEDDIELLVHLLKLNLKEQYFDKDKASKLISKLEYMEDNHKFVSLTVMQAAELLTKLLRKETNDKHFNVIAAPSESQTKSSTSKSILSAAGISDYRIVNHNLGYIKWDLCLAGEQAFKEYRKVLDSLSSCKGLIFDLSDNPGGDGASSAFLNQFLYHDKSYQTLLKKKCTGETDWHQSEVIFNYTNGPSFFDKPIYIITSNNTFSAAEYFALTAKEMKRATIFGETTAGAGNPGISQSYLTEKSNIILWMFIPNCQIITRTGLSIEGHGVKPDVILKTKNRLKETIDYINKQLN